MDFFSAVVDIPLSIWYLTYYPNPTTQYIVIAKILIDSFHATGCAYADYIETYLYYERFTPQDQEPKKNPVNGYDNSSPINVLLYSFAYVILCPFIALAEVAIAANNAVLKRDLMFQQEEDDSENVEAFNNKVSPINQRANMNNEGIELIFLQY